MVKDPGAAHQPLAEASHVNLPTTALCNADSALCSVGIAIPSSNKGAHSAGLRGRVLA